MHFNHVEKLQHAFQHDKAEPCPSNAHAMHVCSHRYAAMMSTTRLRCYREAKVHPLIESRCRNVKAILYLLYS